MAAINLTKSEFLKRVMDYETNPNEWKFEGDKPAVIDFFAPWCGPCKMLLPIVEEVADEYAGRVDVYKVNVDEEEELAQVFGIRSVPTLIFIPKEGAPQRVQGALPKAQLKNVIEENLLK